MNRFSSLRECVSFGIADDRYLPIPSPPTPGRSTKGKKRKQKHWPPRLSGLAPKHPAYLEKTCIVPREPRQDIGEKHSKLNDRNIFKKQKCTTCLYKYTGRQEIKNPNTGYRKKTADQVRPNQNKTKSRGAQRLLYSKRAEYCFESTVSEERTH